MRVLERARPQFYLIAAATEATGDGWWLGASRYFGFFTILTNLLVATVLSASLFPQRLGSWLSSVNVKSATATYIAMVGIVYTLVLHSLWDPEGLQRVADVVLHDVVPVSYVLYWVVLVEKGSLRWSGAARWLIYPALYLIYAMVRGAVSGWYPYPFIDAGQLGYAQVSLNALGLITVFAALGLVVVGVDRALARTSRTVIACLLVCACDSPPPMEPQPRELVRRESAPFVGKVWVSTDASAAAGTCASSCPTARS